jgi:hypothetical protein
MRLLNDDAIRLRVTFYVKQMIPDVGVLGRHVWTGILPTVNNSGID